MLVRLLTIAAVAATLSSTAAVSVHQDVLRPSISRFRMPADARPKALALKGGADSGPAVPAELPLKISGSMLPVFPLIILPELGFGSMGLLRDLTGKAHPHGASLYYGDANDFSPAATKQTRWVAWGFAALGALEWNIAQSGDKALVQKTNKLMSGLLLAATALHFLNGSPISGGGHVVTAALGALHGVAAAEL